MAQDVAIEHFSQIAALERVQYFLKSSALNCFLALDSPEPSVQDLSDKSRDIADDVCYWLKTEDNTKRLPVYLWDVEKRKTVVTKRILDRPVRYTAISHTWGRYTKTDPKGQKLYATVKGISWQVPLNQRFDVEKIPDILSLVPSGSPYLWLDLACIPQLGLPGLTKFEIGRQAKIFRHAKHAIAWFNDVDNFDCLQSLMQWLLLQLLPPRHPEFAIEESRRLKYQFEALSRISRQLTNLFEPRVGDNTNLKVNPWFSSLWTLQELCLRPDMWICSQDWNVLSVDNRNPFPLMCLKDVLLETESHLQETQDPRTNNIEAVDNYNYSHGPFRELQLWSILSDLRGLKSASPAAILSLGDRRDCESQRAEAIMSALGVLNWYKANPSDNNLVLEKYPLSFLKELQAKNAVHFFTAVIKIPWHSKTRHFDRKAGPVKGSLLPFAGARQISFSAIDYGYIRFDSVSHPSLESWQLEVSGQVTITEACIVSSKELAVQEGRNDIDVQLLSHEIDTAKVPKLANPALPEYSDDLHGLILGLDVDGYAVIVSENFFDSHSSNKVRWRYEGIIFSVIEISHGNAMLRKSTQFKCTRHERIPVIGPTRVKWTVI